MASSMQDPFYVVKEEVLQSVQGVSALYERWKDLLNNTNTASNEEFKWTTNELKTGLRSIDWDITDLEETVGIVETNKAKFHIDDVELNSRKQFIQSIKQKIQAIKDDMQGTRTRGKMERDQKDLLMVQKKPADKASKLQAVYEQDNQNYIDGQFQRQEQIVKEQDQNLEQLGHTIGVLKQMGETINEELKEHDELITGLDGDMTRVDSGLKGAIKRVNALLDSTKDSTQWCIIIFLIIALVALLVIVFYV